MYTVNATRAGLDIYEMYHDTQTGFNTRYMGAHPSEKVADCSWSPAGDFFAVCEREGLINSIKAGHTWSFWIIIQAE